MSWLDEFFRGYTTVQVAGIAMPQERIIDFATGVSGSDDATNGRTILNVSGGGTGPYAGGVISSGVNLPALTAPTLYRLSTPAGGAGGQAFQVGLPNPPAPGVVFGFHDDAGNCGLNYVMLADLNSNSIQNPQGSGTGGFQWGTDPNFPSLLHFDVAGGTWWFMYLTGYGYASWSG